MPESTFIAQIVPVLKTVAPWITGGLAGALLTLLVRTRETRRKRKILTVDLITNQYSLSKEMHASDLNPEDLGISYKGRQYRDLVLYRASIRNTGFGGIDSPSIVFLFPKNTKLIEHGISSSPIEVQHEETEKETDLGIEHCITWKRIENSDDVVVSYLLDCPQPESIQCLPRGLEEIDCKIGQTAYQSEMESRIVRLLACTPLFVLFGAIPILGAALQALVILYAIPHILYIVNAIRHRRRSPDRTSQ